MNVFLWHVHGSWTTAFVQGAHRYYLPVDAERGPDGRGRARTWDWPASAIEVTREEAYDLAVDVVVMQRPGELDGLVRAWLGRTPGTDVPAVYLEHDAPQGRIDDMRHLVADRPDLTLCHVTHFNALFYQSGTTPTRVIEHGIVDPGYRYSGELPRAAVAINEGARRGRTVGFDVLPRFTSVVPWDLFGMDAGRFGGYENLRQSELHREMARRRVYLHPMRWTSLGLSLIEAMQLGMPVVGLATTEAHDAVPAEAGYLSTDVDRLVRRAADLLAEPERAREMGRAARSHALGRYGLARFLRDWDTLLADAAS